MRHRSLSKSRILLLTVGIITLSVGAIRYFYSEHDKAAARSRPVRGELADIERVDAGKVVGGTSSVNSTASEQRHKKDFNSSKGEYDYEIVNLEAQFDDFESLAMEGDIKAARALFDALKSCEYAPRSARDVEHLRQRLTDPASIYYSMPSAEQARIYNDKKRLYEKCGIVPDYQKASIRKWALMLAESGDREVRLQYASVGKPMDFTDVNLQQDNEEFMARAKGYLDEEISSGNASALLGMALAYMPPVGMGKVTPFVVDPYQAYQYFYAYGLTQEGSTQYADSVAGNLAKLEDRLEPEEIDSARANGIRIYDRCCRSRSK